jgi:purine-nucleoside phosphorylase
MSAPYDLEMNTKAMAIAEQENITMHSGVYVSVNGPNLETKAEYKFLRLIGADVVGMSTVPEVIVANHMQIPVFAISVITDEGFPEILKPVSLAEIIAIAQKAEPKMTTIIKKLIALA